LFGGFRARTLAGSGKSAGEQKKKSAEAFEVAEGGASVELRTALVECHDCGLRHRPEPLPEGSRARCRRCRAVLRTHSPYESCLALALTGLVLVAAANFMPFMSINIEGQERDASFVTGALSLLGLGYWPLAAVILLVTVVMPTVKLGSMAYVLAALRMARPPRHIIPILRWIDELHPWSMVEVYMLGLFVAYVRLEHDASILLHSAVYSLFALMVVMAAIDHIVDFDDLWEAVERKGLVPLPPDAPAQRLVRCGACGILAPMLAPHARCYRCGARLHRRKPDSIARCWALVVTAAILYIPANVYPILTVVSFGQGDPHTIISGVLQLLAIHDYPIALLVAFASVAVPLLKITGLTWLLLTTQRGSRWHLRDRTRLYRIIDSVGRWSMIDIFMMSILVALVRFDAVASIYPGAAAISFAAVVVTTMFAAMAFDPRLMWDKAGENS
jgi:paraquat-inducible protein A